MSLRTAFWRWLTVDSTNTDGMITLSFGVVPPSTVPFRSDRQAPRQGGREGPVFHDPRGARTDDDNDGRQRRVAGEYRKQNGQVGCQVLTRPLGQAEEKERSRLVHPK